MRKLYWFLGCFIFTGLTIAFFLIGCGDSGSGGGENPCGGDYLWCFSVDACCPAGYPYYCDGQCRTSPGTGCNRTDICRQ
ncbi:MAG: hypothetical protein HY787_08710 [Deltaproteobacteria bacterium]|nr:hypothetical protein [Deltaproteobacteria bacterium]